MTLEEFVEKYSSVPLAFTRIHDQLMHQYYHCKYVRCKYTFVMIWRNDCEYMHYNNLGKLHNPYGPAQRLLDTYGYVYNYWLNGTRYSKLEWELRREMYRQLDELYGCDEL